MNFQSTTSSNALPRLTLNYALPPGNAHAVEQTDPGQQAVTDEPDAMRADPNMLGTLVAQHADVAALRARLAELQSRLEGRAEGLLPTEQAPLPEHPLNRAYADVPVGQEGEDLFEDYLQDCLVSDLDHMADLIKCRDGLAAECASVHETLLDLNTRRDTLAASLAQLRADQAALFADAAGLPVVDQALNAVAILLNDVASGQMMCERIIALCAAGTEEVNELTDFMAADWRNRLEEAH